MATLQFKRGTTFIDPQIAEPFLDTGLNVLKLGISGSDFITLLDSGSLSSNLTPLEDRLDNIELTTSSLNTSVSNLNSFTQSFNTAISLNSSNVTILGNLDVQGTTTTIDSTTITLGDNVIELNGTGDINGGILVNDVTNPNTISGSLLWDGTNDYWKAGQLGSENEIITTANIVSNLPSGTISGSSQITITESQISDLSHTDITSLNSYTASNDTTNSNQNASLNNLNSYTASNDTTNTTQNQRLSALESFTGSIDDGYVTEAELASATGALETADSLLQSRANNLESFTSSIETTIKTKLDAEGVISGSSQIDHDQTLNYSADEHFTQGNITTVGTVTTGNVDAILPSGTISGSTQITITQSQISDLSHTDISSLNSYTSSNDTINATQNQRLTSIESFTGSIDNDFVTEAELASATGALETADSLLQSRTSNLESFTSSIDTTIKTKLDSDGVISGSSQIDHDLTTNFVANEHIDHSSITIGSGKGLSGGGTIDTNRSITLDTGSSHFTDGVVQSLPTGTVSGSSQVDVTQTTNYSSINQYTDSDTQAYIDSIGLISGSVSGQLPSGVVSGSSQVDVTQTTNYSQVVNISDAQSITGTKTFEDIIVNGTGSFAYIEQVTGSAKIIGDAFIILNNNTPSERYAGISVYDSGSSNNTSSLIYDGSTDDWFFEKDVLGSAEYGVAMFGPEYSTKGTPTYLTNNTVPKGNGGHHLNDSNITDNGSTISLDSTLYVTQSRIGIGTTAPDAKLEIQTVSDNELLRFHRTNASAGDVDITFYHGTSDLASKITHHYVGGGKGELGFRTGEGSTLGLYQNQNGEVGIGTDSPSSKLHATSADSNTIFTLGNTGAGGVDWAMYSANNSSAEAQSGGDLLFRNASSNILILQNDGDVLMPSGNVGINTSTPGQFLEIKETANGAGDAVIRLRGHGNNADNTILGAVEWWNADGSGDQPGVVARIEAQSGNSNGHMGELVFKTHDGSEGGEGSSPKENMRLDVDGNLFVSGTIRAQGDIIAFSSSDRRLKDNLIQIDTPLTKITQISGYSFDWNTEKQHIYKGKDYGVVAQEIQEVLPELVQERENGYLAVNYEKLVPLLIESIKELKTQVEHLNKKLEK